VCSSAHLKVWVGINTGDAVVALGARPEQGEGIVTGDVVNTAARIQAPFGAGLPHRLPTPTPMASGEPTFHAGFVPQTSVYRETHRIGPLARSSSMRWRPRSNACSEIRRRPEKTFCR
jgi:hypothetical protein